MDKLIEARNADVFAWNEEHKETREHITTEGKTAPRSLAARQFKAVGIFGPSVLATSAKRPEFFWWFR